MEGHINMLFATVDSAQHCHVIGYGICGSEDASHHTHIVECLREEMEALVLQRQKDQEQI